MKARHALERSAKSPNLHLKDDGVVGFNCVNELGAQGREISQREGEANRQYEFETSYQPIKASAPSGGYPGRRFFYVN